MSVERLEHPRNRAVDEAIGLDLVDVAGLDDVERRGERALVFGEPILRGRDVASHDAADKGGDRDWERADRKKPRASHASMLTNNPCTSNDFRGVLGCVFLDRGREAFL